MFFGWLSGSAFLTLVNTCRFQRQTWVPGRDPDAAWHRREVAVLGEGGEWPALPTCDTSLCAKFGVALHVPEGLRLERHLRTLDFSVKRNVMVSSPHQIFRAWYEDQRVELAFRSKFCSLFSHSKGCSCTKTFTTSCNLRVEGSASLLRVYQHSSAVHLQFSSAWDAFLQNVMPF